MPNIIAKAIFTNGSQYRTIVIAYYPELDTPMKNNGIELLQTSPFKAFKYVDQSIIEEWEYDYEGRSANRFYVEIGKAVANNWKVVEMQKNFTVDD